jgi:hypothetical protein
MSKSAKQTRAPSAAAGAAVPEAAINETAAAQPAVTEGEPGQTEAATVLDTTGLATAGLATTGNAASPDAPAAEAGETAKPDLDETKRKFREALERKHQAHAEGQGKGGRDASKINGAHGPAANRRNFRRKSG